MPSGKYVESVGVEAGSIVITYGGRREHKHRWPSVWSLLARRHRRRATSSGPAAIAPLRRRRRAGGRALRAATCHDKYLPRPSSVRRDK